MIVYLWILCIGGVFLSLLVSLSAIEHDEQDTEEYHGWWREENEPEK
jgi:hypothetical protein